METLSLKEFVTVTLIDLCEAVEAAREKHDYIAPKIFVDPNNKGKATEVNFDMAVTVTGTTTSEAGEAGKAGAGLKIGIFRAEADFSAEEKSGEERARSEVSRIQFSVPVYFQFDKEEREQLIKQQRQQATKRRPTKPIVGRRK